MPQFVARARPKPRLARLDGASKTLRVHVSKRQHLARTRVLDDRGYQTTLVKFQTLDIEVHLTSNPRPRR